MRCYIIGIRSFDAAEELSGNNETPPRNDHPRGERADDSAAGTRTARVPIVVAGIGGGLAGSTTAKALRLIRDGVRAIQNLAPARDRLHETRPGTALR